MKKFSINIQFMYDVIYKVKDSTLFFKKSYFIRLKFYFSSKKFIFLLSLFIFSAFSRSTILTEIPTNFLKTFFFNIEFFLFKLSQKHSKYKKYHSFSISCTLLDYHLDFDFDFDYLPFEMDFF